MRKLGTRVLAGVMAALVVASGFGTPVAANAEEELLIATAPTSVKTLYITEDMVDDDGEIVISGEDWDRVVIAKEVDAKDIYFDQVNVGELVVESGSKINVQLWEVDAEKVTVQEPELKALTVTDLLPLLADVETQAEAIALYEKTMAENESTLNKAPSIVTMADAKINEVVARANVSLDLAEGEVSNVALEASDKVDRAKVTLKNYEGDVSYKGGEGLGAMTLNENAQYIDTMGFYNSGTVGMGVTMLSCGEKFCLNFKQSFESDKYVKAFLWELSSLGIEYQVSEAIPFLTPKDSIIKRG